MAGRFKYADPNILLNPLPGEVQSQGYSDPVRKAMEVLGPQAPGNDLPPMNTIDDVTSNVNQINTLKQLVSTIPREVALGRQPADIAEAMNRDQRGFMGKTFDYLTKPFRYETSVFTAPVVSAIEAARMGEGLEDFVRNYSLIYPQLQKAAATGERELSIYDALRRSGMSNWGAVPLGFAGDMLLSPSTYTGVGGLTKLGRLARTATLAEKAGQTIVPGSKVGSMIADLSAKIGTDAAAEALRLAPTMSDQVAAGQRALLKFMGLPVIEGKPVFEGIEKIGDVIRNNETLYKIASGLRTNIRPKGVTPEAWQDLLNLKRVRATSVGVRSREFLDKLESVASEHNLSPEQLEEVFYTMGKASDGDSIPWDKVSWSEASDPTMIAALRAKYPGLTPTVSSLDEADFLIQAKGHKKPKTVESFTTGGPSTQTNLWVKSDPDMTAAGEKAWERSLQLKGEGENLFSVLPEKTLQKIKKAYGVEGIEGVTPEMATQFGSDWEKFMSGQDWALSKKFKNAMKDITEKDGGHLLVDGVKDVTMPDGTIRRVVGDIKFLDQGQEAVRSFVKGQFDQLIQEEQSLGILNKAVEDYIPGIYRYTFKPFRSGKEISTSGFFTKEKAFASPIEAEKAGYEPVKNILELVGIRTHKSLQAQESAKLLSEAEKLFGIPARRPTEMANHDWAKIGKAGVNPENYTQLTTYLRKEGYVPIGTGKNEVWYQPEIAASLNKVNEVFTNDETMKAFLQSYDKALNVWKGYVTSVNPKFHARNFVSNLFLLYLKDGAHGINPFRHSISKDILSGEAGQLATKTGQMFTYDDIRKMIDEVGLRGSGFMSGEMGAAFRSQLDQAIGQGSKLTPINPMSSKNAAIEFGRKFGTSVENEAKVVGFINDLIEHGNPLEAAKNTYKYLYDYMDLTSFEKNFAKRLIPFWTWMSRNIPAMMVNMITQPGKMAGPMAKFPTVMEHKTKAELREKGISYPDEIQPEFIKDQGAFPVGVDDQGRVSNYVPGLPYMDLARLSLKELASGITPMAKPFAEWLPKGGYSIFMDRPYEQYEGQMVDAPMGVGLLPQSIKDALGVREEQYGTYMPGEAAAIINTLLPMLRTPGKIRESFRAPNDAKYLIPSELFGQKFIPVDPRMERRSTLIEWLKQVQSPGKIARGVERKEGRKAVEQDPDMNGLSLEEILQLRGLHYQR
jgi:hypothetical protein